MPDTQELIEALENLERYLRDTPHHNAVEAAAARKALSRARSADEQPVASMVICPDCNGAGGDNNTYTCGRCNGAGGVSTPPDNLVEVVAQFLHDEGGFDEAWLATWPEHPDDTGQRDGGFVRIVPSDVQAKFRDVARRLVGMLSPHLSEREKVVAWLLRHYEGELSANFHTQQTAKLFANALSRGDHISGEGR